MLLLLLLLVLLLLLPLLSHVTGSSMVDYALAVIVFAVVFLAFRLAVLGWLRCTACTHSYSCRFPTLRLAVLGWFRCALIGLCCSSSIPIIFLCRGWPSWDGYALFIACLSVLFSLSCGWPSWDGYAASPVSSISLFCAAVGRPGMVTLRCCCSHLFMLLFSSLFG